MAVTIHDIAKAAQVSIATVSMVLNNKPGISDATRQKVLEAAAESGYHSNNHKSQHEAGVIQLTLYKKHAQVLTDTAFFQELIEGIEAKASQRGYQINIKTIYAQDMQNINLSDMIDNNNVDGILLLATELSAEDFKQLNCYHKPLLVLDSYFDENAAVCVGIDNMHGAYTAAAYLYENGHREIGYLQSSIEIVNFKERYNGYQLALMDHSVPIRPEYTIALAPTITGAYEDMMQFLLNAPKLPTAFVSDNDIIATGAMKALKENGIEIPGSISVVGFDDMPFCTIMDPALTTIQVNKRNLGESAVEKLIDIIGGKVAYPSKTLMGVHLIKRDSVASI